MICSVPSCNFVAHAKGFCYSHYKRLLTHGEVFPDKPLLKFPRKIQSICKNKFCGKIIDAHQKKYSGHYCSEECQKEWKDRPRKYHSPISGYNYVREKKHRYQTLFPHKYLPIILDLSL